MKHIEKMVVILFMSVLIFFHRFTAADVPLWGHLKPGPYKVGFKFINVADYSRSSFTKPGNNDLLQSHDRGRQIQIYLWYPVSPSVSKLPMLIEKYVLSSIEDFGPHQEAQKDLFECVELPLVRGLSMERLSDLLKKPLDAIEKSPVADGLFPLIIFGQGLYYESPITHTVLCEYLASFGFVIATSPLMGTNSYLVNLNLIDLETQVRTTKMPRKDSNSLKKMTGV